MKRRKREKTATHTFSGRLFFLQRESSSNNSVLVCLFFTVCLARVKLIVTNVVILRSINFSVYTVYYILSCCCCFCVSFIFLSEFFFVFLLLVCLIHMTLHHTDLCAARVSLSSQLILFLLTFEALVSSFFHSSCLFCFRLLSTSSSPLCHVSISWRRLYKIRIKLFAPVCHHI